MKRVLLTSIIVVLLVGCSTNSTKAFLHERDRPEGFYQILKQAKPFYSPELRKKKIEGWVIVRFSIDATRTTSDEIEAHLETLMPAL